MYGRIKGTLATVEDHVAEITESATRVEDRIGELVASGVAAARQHQRAMAVLESVGWVMIAAIVVSTAVELFRQR